MKYKLLATLVASTLLAGCHMDDETPAASKSVQAFDGAIWGIEGKYNCDGGISGSSGFTNYDGFVQVKNQTFIDKPETCSFEFGPTVGAKDISNGKLMSDVSYKAPKGLFKKGQAATASPITTLVAKALEESGEEYTEEAATAVLVDLGINTSVVDTTALLTNPEKTLKDLEKEDPKGAFQEIAAVTFVLSDVLVAQGDNKAVSVKDIAVATKKVSKKLVEENQDFPKGNNGDVIKESFVSVLEDDTTFADVADETKEELPTAIEDKAKKPETGKPIARPENPNKRPTGATGANADDAAGTGA